LVTLLWYGSDGLVHRHARAWSFGLRRADYCTAARHKFPFSFILHLIDPPRQKQQQAESSLRFVPLSGVFEGKEND